MINLSMFVGSYLGVPKVGDTPGNQGECVGLIEKWLDANRRPHIWGNASTLLIQAASLGGYIVTQNLPLNAPPAGAIVVWGSTWGNGYGHTAIALAGNRHLLAVFEQNNPIGHAPVVATHDYNGVLGWIAWFGL